MSPLTSDNPLREALGRSSGILAAALILGFFYNLISLAGPMFMLLVFDRVLPSRSEETLVTLFLLVVVLLLVLGLIDYARRRILARFGAQFQERIEERLFSTTAKGKYFQRSGRKPMAGLDELDNLRSFFHSRAMIAAMDLIWAPMFLFAIFFLHVSLGWIVLAGMAVLALLAGTRALTSAGREERDQRARGRIADLKDMASSARDVIRAQELTSAYRDRWVAARQSSRDLSIELRDLTTWFSVLARQAQALIRYAVLAFGAWLVLRGELTVGAMVASTFLAVRAVNPLDSFLDELPAVWRSFSNWVELRTILTAKSNPETDAGIDAPMAPAALLSLQRVSARAPLTGMTILNTLSQNFAPGRLIEISGPSGCGKTLLAEVMLGLAQPFSGQVLYRSASVARLSPAEARRAFGYVPESPDFVNGTIAENIARLDPSPDRARIIAAAQQARIHDMIMALPEGYETRLDTTQRQFSRGQRSQIALARALCDEPDLLILDEPDPVLRRLLARELRPMIDTLKSRGCLIVTLTREPLGLRNCSTRFTLENGRLKRVVPEANVTQLAASDGKVAPLIRG
ncbi:ATP-binding cassette domain-containing protein [Neogemmobacter tilapiae]|uniref:Protease/lipase ABC transporter permease/ATP-binding protein n=1 Tax=Neogemmobacter tilapiae TaxID=875041 RepID=A0A918WND4_9RHOB|nr:ATP-binding cassette domain-containing protein [Gemmobacter tilapiae]GHC59302.1 protease/lipase ABC transporter permease/ATP-binding protein [Gemmobacter tilapiae]